MTRIQSNEREFQSQVVSWLNRFIEQGGCPFELATAETSLKSEGASTLFPDVQLWINREAEEGFCGWELKTPDTAVDDLSLLENAAEKARRMRARYFVIWNMRDAVIWKIS